MRIRIRIWDPGIFLTMDPGIFLTMDPGIFLTMDPGIFLTMDPGWKKFGSGIRDKRPESATVLETYE